MTGDVHDQDKMPYSRRVAIGVRVMEECNELAQRISKALLFGIEERQPGQDLTNRERIYQEYFDLRAVLGMFGIDAWVNNKASQLAEQQKYEKVERFIHYAIDRGEQASVIEESERATKDDLDALRDMFQGSSADLMESERYRRLSRFLEHSIDTHLKG